jgi:F-box-like
MRTHHPGEGGGLAALPHEILVLIATTPQDLCLIAQTCKILYEVSSDDRVWKPIFMKYRRYAYNKKDNVSWKAATLGINHVRYAYVFFPTSHS